MRYALLLILLLASYPVLASRMPPEAPSAPVNYSVVETVPATHSQQTEPPPGCILHLKGPQGNLLWAYTEYAFICQLKPEETIKFYIGTEIIDECDTGEQGAFRCGLHGVDKEGYPIDRPPVASLTGMDVRAIPDIVGILERSENFRARQYVAMLEEYLQNPDFKPAVMKFRDRLAAIQWGEDNYKHGAMVGLLLAMGIEQPVGESMAMLADYAGNLQPKHLMALATIASHPDDPSIKAADVMSFYVRNFVDSSGNEDPNRAKVAETVMALGHHLQPSVGLLLDRIKSARDWPDSLRQEAAQVACAAFKPENNTATPQTLIIDNYGGARAISCP